MAFPDLSVIAVVVLFMAIALCWFIVPPRPAAFAGPPKFVVWYRTPLRDRLEYLAFMPPYDEGQYSAPEGEWYYTTVLANAYRFDTREEAMRRAPTYDGSNGIEARTGVYTVNA